MQDSIGTSQENGENMNDVFAALLTNELNIL
jgi:hypothetical protein